MSSLFDQRYHCEYLLFTSLLLYYLLTHYRLLWDHDSFTIVYLFLVRDSISFAEADSIRSSMGYSILIHSEAIVREFFMLSLVKYIKTALSINLILLFMLLIIDLWITSFPKWFPKIMNFIPWLSGFSNRSFIVTGSTRYHRDGGNWSWRHYPQWIINANRLCDDRSSKFHFLSTIQLSFVISSPFSFQFPVFVVKVAIICSLLFISSISWFIFNRCVIPTMDYQCNEISYNSIKVSFPQSC